MKIFCVLFLYGMCSISAHAQVFSPREGDDDFYEEYINDMQWIYRNINDIVIGVSMHMGNDGYFKSYTVGFFIQNNSDHPFTFDPKDVYASLTSHNGEAEPLYVYTNAEYQKKIKRSQGWTLGLQAFGAGLSSYSTAVSRTHTPYGTYTTHTHYYNPSAAYNASMQLSATEDRMKNDRKEIANDYLKKNTVYPGDSMAGYMNIAKKKGSLLTVDIFVDGNKYCFDWDVSNKKSSKAKSKSREGKTREKKDRGKTSRTVYYSIMY